MDKVHGAHKPCWLGYEPLEYGRSAEYRATGLFAERGVPVKTFRLVFIGRVRPPRLTYRALAALSLGRASPAPFGHGAGIP